MRRLPAAARARLIGYRWPGNVRELAHEIERALVFEDGEKLTFAHLSVSFEAVPSDQAAWLKPGFVLPESGFSLEETIGQFMHLALSQAGGNVFAAARLLGVPLDYVRYRLGLKNRKCFAGHQFSCLAAK